MGDRVNDPAHQVEPLITADEAAGILAVHVNWIYKEASAGRLPSYQIGRQRKFRASDLEDYIQGAARGKLATVTTLGRRR